MLRIEDLWTGSPGWTNLGMLPVEWPTSNFDRAVGTLSQLLKQTCLGELVSKKPSVA